MKITREMAEIIRNMILLAGQRKYEFITPELMLLVLCENTIFRQAYIACGGTIPSLSAKLEEYLKNNVECTEDNSAEPQFSNGTTLVFSIAQATAKNNGNQAVGISHFVHAVFGLQDSYAAYYMMEQGVEEVDLLQELELAEAGFGVGISFADEDDDEMDDIDEDEDCSEAVASKVKTENFAPCLNDTLGDVNPLIGREKEIERTIQILCRKDKNNPLHIGEPGVGKTAITYGLVQLLRENRVPDALKGARVYALDLGGALAGTKYRGEFERRLKGVLESLAKDEKPIIFIDEIHNLLGAGATGEGSFDAANILKPYMAAGHIRFIGATTYEEYKKSFERSKSLVRRFQNIDISEPSQEETVRILEGLKGKYEKFHGVVYGKGVLEYAVSMSTKYINERFLPDKAIDLIDEAGAYRRIHPLEQKRQTVGKDLIDLILTNICKVPVQSVQADDMSGLKTLERRLLSKIFGQDKAVSQVVNAVKFSRAGLIEATKPLASLLFVGPTGVGKTEIAKTLAAELGIKLVRFDMSEYGEKHAVAKLIGAPAGYVGYEEGGLLTEQIRKNPSCVLLLDEIEKAHPDIYSTLLQVMDYATLTDNQGRKADFRNVIIIMTSNAGASRLGKSGMGFQSEDRSADTLMEEVKHVFQPEFRNRLSGIVVFNGMDDDMAGRIARKKLKELADMLEARKVSFAVDEKAVELLRTKGTSREYGAREMDRIIGNEIKPLLVDDLLYGRLKKGGKCELSTDKDSFTVKFEA